MRNHIRFILNDREISSASTSVDFGASDTLLDFIRLHERLTGTKEGCAEGDCGACTVLVGRRHEGGLVYESVNACIRLLASVDCCHVVTVEHLRGENGKLHPVQQAMVDLHASQCGFCTPGIVMSLYCLWMSNRAPSSMDIETALQGNLCRCTGYEPIVKAAMAASATGSSVNDVLNRERKSILAKLEKMDNRERVEIGSDGNRAILPENADDLAAVLAEHPDATIVAGSTDVGLWITKFMRDISPAVFIGHLSELKGIEQGKDKLVFGAGVTYQELEAVIGKSFPHLAAYWNRIGGAQVRNMGTIGGNIANGSPIGDTPPVLIALGASITLRQGKKRRTVLLEDFFIDYGKQDRKAGDFVESITVPIPDKETINRAYKISKRRDEDISSVCAGFNCIVEKGIVKKITIAYGGMAATPKRAKHVEAALLGKPWTLETIVLAEKELEKDFTPISDMRASADYRALAAKGLIRRFYLESSGAGQSVQIPRNNSARVA